MKLRLIVIRALLPCALMAGGTLAFAQSYPVRPIRIIVPFTPGTALPYAQDGKLRVLAQSGARRSRVAPNYPTFEEAGARGVDVARCESSLSRS